MSKSPTATDGLRARPGGTWTRAKLTYLRKYASAFMTAMAPKREKGLWRELVFIDLLCGPGICIDDRGEEFDGSPLIAIGTRPAFDQLYLGDLSDKNIEVLRKRIPESERDRVHLLKGDCNKLAQTVVDGLSSKTLALAFIDPEGFEATFEMFKSFSRRAVDIVFLFPSGIGIKRNLRQFARQRNSPMDGLWGNRSWRETRIARLLSGETLNDQEAGLLDHSWTLAFCDRVKALGYAHHDSIGPLRNEQNVPMYHLLFFSKNAAGLRIWRGITKIEPSGQRTMQFD